ncbi:Maf-like protein [mine drainage metagenome]|uniref:Maf-like protein n=1 Tax=mine drainage metagenome TaxID=410659 RepID=T1C7E7_9ZZZZ
MNRTLILASTSAYRAALLRRLGRDFLQIAPDCDERALPGEPVAAQAQRLAAGKAASVAARHPDALVLGSDQLAERDGQPVGKPGTHAAARAQLAAASGRTLRFHTAWCLIDVASGQRWQGCDLTSARLRMLDAASIERYLERERPYDCAGSFKSEGLGIALFERIDSSDPTALIGLPLIAVAAALRAAGLEVP